MALLKLRRRLSRLALRWLEYAAPVTIAGMGSYGTSVSDRINAETFADMSNTRCFGL